MICRERTFISTGIFDRAALGEHGSGVNAEIEIGFESTVELYEQQLQLVKTFLKTISKTLDHQHPAFTLPQEFTQSDGSIVVSPQTLVQWIATQVCADPQLCFVKEVLIDCSDGLNWSIYLTQG